MKRLFSLFAMIMLLASIFTVSISATAPTASIMTNGVDFIAGYTVNLRSTQSSSGSIVATAPKRSTLNNSDNGGWIWSKTSWTGVSYHGTFGYARNDLIMPSQNAKTIYTSSGVGVRLRYGHGTDYGYTYVLPVGTYVCVVGSYSTWRQVRVYAGGESYDEALGWVQASYLATLNGI